MNRFVICLLSVGFRCAFAFGAQDPITLTIDSLTNVSGNGALEACGIAIHSDGIKPLMVTLKHSSSYYTTLTSPNGNWCVVFKRWAFNGQVSASATTFQNPGVLNFRNYTISLDPDK